MQSFCGVTPADTFVHPGTAALVLASIHIQVELATHCTRVVLDAIEVHIFMPAVEALDCLNLQAIEALHYLKQALDHERFREVWLQFFL